MKRTDSALVKAWRISKKNSPMALGHAWLMLVIAILGAILFVIVFNYHDEFETLGELLRMPAMIFLGIFIGSALILSTLFLCRYSGSRDKI